MFFHPIEQVNLCQIFLVAFCSFNRFVDASIQNIQVREDEFEVDNFDIAFWTDAALDMDNFSVLKAADNVNNRVYFADIGEKFISQTFTLEAPFTRPAISTNSMTAGVTLSGW